MERSLGIALDPANSEPLFAQLAERIKGRIRSGVYPPGFRLPPTRELAAELHTHRNTVVRAFEELATEGWVTATVGRGTFVAERERSTALPAAAPNDGGQPWNTLASRAAQAEPLGRLERLPRPAATRDPIDLTRMQPSPDLLPSELLRKCLDHVLRTAGPKALAYAPRDGVPKLRALIAGDLVRRGVPATADDVIITTGSQQALDLVARALIDPGDTFLVEEATYPGAINLLTSAGARLTEVPSDESGPELAALSRLARSGVKGFYLMPSCRNPTGTSIATARREQLVAWSRSAEVPLIEDDYGADLVLDDRPLEPALRALDAEVLYLGTFSKKLIPALRVGFLVAPASLRRMLVPLKHTMDLGTSGLLQLALAEFLERGYLRTHLRRTLPEYRRRRDALEAALREHLPAEVTFRHVERGVVAWLRLPPDVDPVAVFGEAQRQGVLVTPSTLHRVGSGGEGGLRLTFCAEPVERLREGAGRLGRALNSVMARGRAAAPSLEGV